jgi:stage IV sporulation protein FB
MSDLLSWSIDLGRWAGTRVRIHFSLVLMAAISLLRAVVAPGSPVLPTLAWVALLLVALVWHELGHTLMASRLGAEREEVRIWPLGNFVGPTTSTAGRSIESILVAMAGPLASALAALVAATVLALAGSRLEFNPFGAHFGTPLLDGKPVADLSPLWFVGWFGYLNWVLFVANLIPALPFDAGRALRGLLALYNKDAMIAPYAGRALAIVFGLVGLYTLYFARTGAVVWLLLAMVVWLMVRLEVQVLEETGFFEEGGVFGYDFSQGYTSLEAGAPKVRPRRESALRRWRRRRSELRRQRREAQEAAEAQRMDEILLKIHEQGRASLTDEETRFLTRVSAKIRSRRHHEG